MKYRWIAYDPDLSYYGHPFLPAGYNADDNNGDELNGAGTNWPVWPVMFDTFESLNLVVMNDEALDAFETACPDYIVAGMNNIITWPMQNPEMAARNLWSPLALADQSNVIVVPFAAREAKVRPELDTAVAARSDQTETIRGVSAALKVPAEQNNLSVPPQSDETKIRHERDTVTPRGDPAKTIASESDTATVPGENRTKTVRRKA